MKKNVLLLLLSSLMLSSCDFLPNFLTKSKSSENTQNNEKNSENPGENDDSTPKDETIQNEFTATILTSGDSFSELFDDGYGFEDGDNVTNLENYFSTQLSKEGLLTSLTVSKLFGRSLDEVVYLQFGASASAGSLVWESTKKIYKVEIKAMPYSKYYNSEYHTDTASKLSINGEVSNVSGEASVKPEPQTFSKTFDSGITSLQIGSAGGRVLLHQLKITWGD